METSTIELSPVAAARAVVEDPEYLKLLTEIMQDTGDDVTKASVLETARSVLANHAEPAASKTRPTSPDSLLGAEQVAELLSVSTQTVWRLSREGKIPTVRLGPKTLRYRRNALLEWLAELETLSAA